jgi:CubicO group peptidase (beta-lactamase class C family)
MTHNPAPSRSGPEAGPPGLPAAVRVALAEMARDAHVPGISIAVVARDRVLCSGAVGYSDVDGGIPSATDTVYLWFSMTKPVTATAAMRLSDEGRLDLHAPLHEYVEWLRAPGRTQPTMWQLLTHSSGLGNPLPVRWIHSAASPGPDQAAMLRKLINRRRPFKHAVGGKGHYSNVGYLAAAQIISEAAGEPFPSYVRREILDPLHMTSTGFTYGPGRPAATGYVRLPPPLAPLLAGILPPGTLGPRHGGCSSLKPFLVDGAGYGGLVGNVLDAAKFAQLHLNDGLAGPPDGAGPPGRHRVLQESTARAMREINVKGTAFEHSAGWFRKPARGQEGPYVEHFGTGLGFWNIMRLYPERGIGVVIMSNSTTGYDYRALFSLILRTPWTGSS